MRVTIAELRKVIDWLQPGDVLVVTRLAQNREGAKRSDCDLSGIAKCDWTFRPRLSSTSSER
jgi:hypothetical protein